jgi:ATPase subunit of ABC transporter with duplicated ATPase domains
VVISHDRWFLDRICTHILAFEGNSDVYYFEGGFSEYEERKKRLGGDLTPKRLKYRKLIRVNFSFIQKKKDVHYGILFCWFQIIFKVI